MYKNSIPEAPELGQIAKFASFLDSIGEHADAQILDEYIEKAATYNEFEILKQAGLWGNIWKRLKGSVKKMFISEYRELYDEAKRSQDKLEERILKIRDEGKNIKESFKNYNFGEWRGNIARLQMQGLQTSDIMQGFEAKYAKFVNYVTDHFKDGGGESTSEFQAMTGKPSINEKDDVALKSVFDSFDGDGWFAADGRKNSIQIYAHDNKYLRINKEFYDSWKEANQFKPIPGEPGVFVVNTDIVSMKGKDGKTEQYKRPENLKNAFSNFKWKKIGTQKDENSKKGIVYVYFLKVGQIEESISSESIPVKMGPTPPVESLSPKEKGKPGDQPSPVGQVPPSPVGQVPSSPVGQVPSSPVGQVSQSPVEQVSQSPVEQVPSSPVEQVPSSPVGQVPSSPVGQVPSSPVGLGDPPHGIVPGEEKILIDNESVVNKKDLKELEVVQRLSKLDKFPVKGIPIGTHWVRYLDGKYFGPVVNYDPKRHEIVKKDSTKILDLMWAKRENEAREKENKPIDLSASIMQRKNKIISISQQLDISARKQRILELSKK